MNCKDCKHFARGGIFQHKEPNLILDETKHNGLCLNQKVASDHVDGWLSRETLPYQTDGIYAGCDENRGYLLVGENFGCIHFEQK
jgi:hypothetical protein